jgi:hypothetical protein
MLYVSQKIGLKLNNECAENYVTVIKLGGSESRETVT